MPNLQRMGLRLNMPRLQALEALQMTRAIAVLIGGKEALTALMTAAEIDDPRMIQYIMARKEATSGGLD